MPEAFVERNAIFAECQKELHRIAALPGLGNRALGVRECDWKLWRIGREWLAGQAEPRTGAKQAGADVYLATHLYVDGGHTALIGDFVRALDAGAGNSHLILTNLHLLNSQPLAEEIRARVALPAAQIHFLEGESPAHRLESLFRQLASLQPRRLFLFHHPDDPLSIVVAQPEIAAQRILVHHVDSAPTFGLHLPGIQIIDLNPIAAAMTRLLGLTSEWLPLTVPDPGARPHGFLRRDQLVTASSGAANKFARDYIYDYAGTLGVVLSATGGWHVHIGALEEKTLGEISAVLRTKGIAPDRFIHVPWTSSVATCLWTHKVDIYLASFPIDGARTKVEVLASGTPYLSHSTRPSESELVWRTGEDLVSLLGNLRDAAQVENRSREMRSHYEQMHHPQIFSRQLADILAGRGGRTDPDREERDRRVMQGMLRSLATSILEAPANPAGG